MDGKNIKITTENIKNVIFILILHSIKNHRVLYMEIKVKQQQNGRDFLLLLLVYIFCSSDIHDTKVHSLYYITFFGRKLYAWHFVYEHFFDIFFDSRAT